FVISGPQWESVLLAGKEPVVPSILLSATCRGQPCSDGEATSTQPMLARGDRSLRSANRPATRSSAGWEDTRCERFRIQGCFGQMQRLCRERSRTAHLKRYGLGERRKLLALSSLMPAAFFSHNRNSMATAALASRCGPCCLSNG